ncbi:hypothetical protein VOLCADRAFT_91218 [Volvox carteri f. nagariensis]|uniref:ATP-dependent RNA helicase n=1 Tax=Volvox carteri f. nagariensis TaxID=3068 RepID=D8TWH6_VOLCA|nr:uncharacterized protein VOLCADRAFT_91218 [Volvox carteri f. nagariensis]EFJ48047.1 hypothetical protein VOLCADRAFT_91218 [Volvox carteri f. nagariensis]|eukprot:XP_002950732.1 hypothetical protein VOLCADRAFT_91218 [Volvox carteri f. nagariensis]
MGPKGLPTGHKQPSLQQQNQRQQQQHQVPPSRVQPAKPTADSDAHSNASVDDDVPLPLVDQKYLSDKKFGEFSISLSSKRALSEVLRYELCSLVQAASIPVCLGPEDVIAKAKTGTGKTLAFIIPTIEKVLARRAPPGKVSALVLSPTRELARQIQTETHKMLTFHPGLHSMVVYGGVDVKKHLRALSQRMPDILIATPGRCWDIMTQSHDRALTTVLDSTRVLVLDEADNLLDMGFRPQISKILGSLPPTSQRQTFLFSATFPADVKSLADVALKRQHRYVDAVGEDVATHTHVEASSLVVPLQRGELALQLLGLIAAHIAQEPDYKIIVFLPTANLTAYYAEAFTVAGLRGVLEIHSRKSQAQRDRASAQFRSESRLVMFSSDVSARGVDYPNVTYVIQLGAPANREQYIHRAGRTGRAGRAGQGTLLLADFERPFLDRLRDLPITPLQPMQLALPGSLATRAGRCGGGNGAPAAGPMTEALLRDPQGVLGRVANQIDYATRARAYQSVLGYYKSHEVLKFRSEQVVGLANQYAAEVLGCPTPPGLLAKTVGKMGLKGVPGLVIVKEGQQGQPPPSSAVPVGPPPTPGQAAAAAAAAMVAAGTQRAGPSGRSGAGSSQQQLQQHEQQEGGAAAPAATGAAGARTGRGNGPQQQLSSGLSAANGSGSAAQGPQDLVSAQPQTRLTTQQGAPAGGRNGGNEPQLLPRAQVSQTPAPGLQPQFQQQQRLQSGRGPVADQAPRAPAQQQQQQVGAALVEARGARGGGRQAPAGPAGQLQQQPVDLVGPALPPGLGPSSRSEPVGVNSSLPVASPPVGTVSSSNSVQAAAAAISGQPYQGGLPPGAQGAAPGVPPPGGAQQSVSAEYAVLAAMLNMPPPYGFIPPQHQQAQALQHMHTQALSQTQVPAPQAIQQQQNDLTRQAAATPVSIAQQQPVQAQQQQNMHAQQQQQQVLQFAHAQAAAMAGLGFLPGRVQVPGGVDGAVGGGGGGGSGGGPVRWWHKQPLKDQAAEITERVAGAKGLAAGSDPALKQAKHHSQPQQQPQGLAGPSGNAVLAATTNGPASIGRTVQQPPPQQQQQQLLQMGRATAGLNSLSIGASNTGGIDGPALSSANTGAGARGQGPAAAMAAAAAAAAEQAQAHAKAQQQVQALSLQQALLQQQQQQAQQQQILLQQQMLQYGTMGQQAPYFLVGQAPLTAVGPQTNTVYANALQQQQQLTPAQHHHLQQQLTPIQLQQLQHLAPAQQQWYLQQLALGGGAAPECKQQ